MQKINEMPYVVKNEVVKKLEATEEYKQLWQLFEYADLNLEDAEVRASVNNEHETVEDDGFIHVSRGNLHFVEHLGQDRKILKRDIKAVEREVDSFINNHLEGLFKAFNEKAWLVINKVESQARDINNQQKHIDNLEEKARQAQQCVEDAEKELKAMVYEAINGEKKFDDLDREELMTNLFAEFEVKGDKAQRAFNKAWDLGHADGNAEIRNEFFDLVDLIK